MGINSAVYDLETAARPIWLEFDLAAARRSQGGSPDTFYLYVSTNCGRSYTQRLRILDGTSIPLYTTSRVVGNFVPTATEWKKHIISLNYLSSPRNVRFRFEVEGGTGGSSLYIDNVKVRAAGVVAVAGIKERRNLVYTNPAFDRLYFDLSASSEIKITDLTGKHILSTRMEPIAGSYLDISGLKRGVYVCRMVQGSYVEAVKVMVD